MTAPAPSDWNGVALAKLTRVLGEKPGQELMSEVLRTLGYAELRSAAEMHEFAEVLSSKGGFAAVIGGLLSMHATMYSV